MGADILLKIRPKPIPLALKKWGSYEITKTGVRFFTKLGFSVFVPKSIIKRLEGMV